MVQTSYQQVLHPWAIYRLTGAVTHVCIGRFRSRSDAEGHLIILRRTLPTGRFEIVFDLRGENEGQ